VKYIIQHSTVKIKENEKKFLSILFDNKKENNFTRLYNCMEKVHAYQTIFQSTVDTSLRDLQYKIVMEVLITNTLLVKY